MSPALADGFLTTVPPGKPQMFLKQITFALIVLSLPEKPEPLVFHLLCQVLSWFKEVSMSLTDTASKSSYLP